LKLQFINSVLFDSNISTGSYLRNRRYSMLIQDSHQFDRCIGVMLGATGLLIRLQWRGGVEEVYGYCSGFFSAMRVPLMAEGCRFTFGVHASGSEPSHGAQVAPCSGVAAAGNREDVCS